jgi:hypothetical protein
MEFQNALTSATYFGRVEPERMNRSEQGEVLFQLRFEYYPLDDQPPGDGEAPVEQAAGEDAGEPVRTVSDPMPAGESEPDREMPAETPAAEPPRRQLPTVTDEDQP